MARAQIQGLCSGSAVGVEGRGTPDSPHLRTRRTAEHAPGALCARAAPLRAPPALLCLLAGRAAVQGFSNTRRVGLALWSAAGQRGLLTHGIWEREIKLRVAHLVMQLPEF